MSTLRCPVCGGNRVSPPTGLTETTQQHLSLVYVRNPKGGVFSKGRVAAYSAFGCACLDCGHVMFFLGPDSLARLREAADELHPTA